MDKDHLVELIYSSILVNTNKQINSSSHKHIKSYLNKLNLSQLRVLSNEFIL